MLKGCEVLEYVKGKSKHKANVLKQNVVTATQTKLKREHREHELMLSFWKCVLTQLYWAIKAQASLCVWVRDDDINHVLLNVLRSLKSQHDSNEMKDKGMFVNYVERKDEVLNLKSQKIEDSKLPSLSKFNEHFNFH